MPIEPQTAREALLEVRRLAAEVHVDTDATAFGAQIDTVALEGLRRTQPFNFELSDEIADRLANALKVLQRVREEGISGLSGEIDQALVLPPQMEPMMERRGFRS